MSGNVECGRRRQELKNLYRGPNLRRCLRAADPPERRRASALAVRSGSLWYWKNNHNDDGDDDDDDNDIDNDNNNNNNNNNSDKRDTIERKW